MNHSLTCRPNRPSARVVAGLAAGLLGLSAAARADVLLVDPSVPTAYTQIQPAVDAAQPDDIIVVRPLADASAHYDPFTVGGKTVAIVGQGALGTIRATTVQVTDTPLGSMVILRGLEFDAPPGVTAISFQTGDGSAEIEDCIGLGGVGDTVAPAPGMFVTASHSVIVNNCQLTGGAALAGGPATDGAPGVSMIAADKLSICGGTITGGAGADAAPDVSAPGGRGGNGLDTHGGWQFISDATVNGGAGGLPGCADVLSCQCGDAGNGGDAISEIDTVLITEALALTPGSAGRNACGTGVAGQPIAASGGSLEAVPGPKHVYYMSYPCQTPIPATFHMEGIENEWVFISAATTPLNKWFSKYDGELHIGGSDLIDFKLLRILDATGVHDTTHPIPDPPPGLTSLIGYTQTVFVLNGSASHVHLGPSSTFLYIGYGP